MTETTRAQKPSASVTTVLGPCMYKNSGYAGAGLLSPSGFGQLKRNLLRGVKGSPISRIGGVMGSPHAGNERRAPCRTEQKNAAAMSPQFPAHWLKAGLPDGSPGTRRTFSGVLSAHRRASKLQPGTQLSCQCHGDCRHVPPRSVPRSAHLVHRQAQAALARSAIENRSSGNRT